MLEEIEFLTKKMVIEHPFNFPIAANRATFVKEALNIEYWIAPNHFRLSIQDVVFLLRRTGYYVPIQIFLATYASPRRISGDILQFTSHGLVINPRWKVPEYIISFDQYVVRGSSGVELMYLGNSKFAIAIGNFERIYYNWQTAFEEYDFLSRQRVGIHELRLFSHSPLTYSG